MNYLSIYLSTHLFIFIKISIHSSLDLQLVVVCCREQEDRSHMINALDRYRVKVPSVDLQDVRAYLKQHLTVASVKSGRTAAELDPERLTYSFSH